MRKKSCFVMVFSSDEVRKEARKLQREIKASKKRVEAMKQGVAAKQEAAKEDKEREEALKHGMAVKQEDKEQPEPPKSGKFLSSEWD